VDISDTGSHIYAKPLSDGSFAVALLNLGMPAFLFPRKRSLHCSPQFFPILTARPSDGTGANAANVTMAWSTLGPSVQSHTMKVRDIWNRVDQGIHEGSFSAEVLGHGVEIIKATPAQLA
jgi:hypothetical protein